MQRLQAYLLQESKNHCLLPAPLLVCWQPQVLRRSLQVLRLQVWPQGPLQVSWLRSSFS